MPGLGWGVICAVVASLWFLASALLTAAEYVRPASFVPGLGYALAAGLAMAGNGVSLVLHAIYLLRFGKPAWLRAVVAFQALCALGTLFWIAQLQLDSRREQRQSDHRTAVFAAIERDDVHALAPAWAQCADTCGSGWLADAAETGAKQAAAFLIERGERVQSGLGQPTRDMRTCEGLYLPLLSALAIAVARDDSVMVDLLYSVSDAGARRSALWTAAKLDRLERLQQLLALGAPRNIRGPILDENNTLLVAAAEGAALRVGRWLIEQQGVPVNRIEPGIDPYPGTPPVHALYAFMSDARDSARGGPFLQMLVSHGVRVDEPRPDGLTLLQEAVRVQNKRAAAVLLAGGAREEALTSDERTRLKALLIAPDQPVYDQRPNGCVPVPAYASQ